MNCNDRAVKFNDIENIYYPVVQKNCFFSNNIVGGKPETREKLN